MLLKRYTVWLLVTGTTLVTALITGVAVAVLGDKVITGPADGLGSLRLSGFNVGYTKQEDRDRLPAGPAFTDHQAGSSTDVTPFYVPVYFQFPEDKVNVGVAVNAGWLFKDDKIAPNVRIGGPIGGNSFYQTNTGGSYDAFHFYEWKSSDTVATDLWALVMKDQFGITNGSWNNVTSVPNATAGDFTIPTEQQFNAYWNVLQQRSGFNVGSGLYLNTDLYTNYTVFDHELIGGGRVPYNEILDDKVNLGDSLHAVYRTPGGTAIKFKRKPFSPEDSIVQLNHSFAYAGNGPGFTTAQTNALTGPDFKNDLIPDGTFQGRYYFQPVYEEYRLVDFEEYSDRQYYYGMLMEAFGFSDREIDQVLDEIGRWEEGLPNVFDGYEQGYWSQGAAQAGPKTAARNDPKPIPDRLPNDGYFHGKGSWGQDYDDQWGLKQIGVTAGDRDGKGAIWPRKAAITKVAVVDTGIDFAHPELDGVLAANFGEIPNNGKDDDNNGYVDDFLGWNFVDGNNDVRDLNGHGTFVAGIIAANTDNGRGIAGVNPFARIIPVKVTAFDNIGSSVDVALGIVYAAKLGARVINVSIAGPLNKAQQAAVKEAVKLGALVVVAAGNDGKEVKDVAPAGLEGVITVAATDQKKQRSEYSNWGPNVDIAAPGNDILSLRAIQTDLMLLAEKGYKAGTNVVGSDKRYYRLTGTSFSAPYVAGVASLLFSLNPKLTAEQVKRMILHSANDIEIPGTDQFTGYGLLDASAAIKADPEFYVEARIDGVKVLKKNGQTFVQLLGTADADRFASASIEIGAGREPTEWKKIAEDINTKVTNGALQDIAAQNFAGEKTWTLRLTAKHDNGRERENRFILNTN